MTVFVSYNLFLRAEKYLSPAKGFFMTLLMPSVRVTADVYAYMFFCDFFNFLVVIFGFASFGVSTFMIELSDLLSYKFFCSRVK
jgi:hypothetical protein